MSRTNMTRLVRADEPHLWDALYYALHVPPGSSPFDRDVVTHPEIARYVSGWMQRAGDLGFRAERDGRVVGACWVRRFAANDRGYGFVDTATPELTIAVWPGHRGLGVGTRLIGETLAEASAVYERVSLSVALTNPARRWYERLGFRQVAAPADGAVTMMRSRSSPRG
ncbi:MAG: GNAT family N-acetyltransferase [Myxococcota bacterium]